MPYGERPRRAGGRAQLSCTPPLSPLYTTTRRRRCLACFYGRALKNELPALRANSLLALPLPRPRPGGSPSLFPFFCTRSPFSTDLSLASPSPSLPSPQLAAMQQCNCGDAHAPLAPIPYPRGAASSSSSPVSPTRTHSRFVAVVDPSHSFSCASVRSLTLDARHAFLASSSSSSSSHSRRRLRRRRRRCVRSPWIPILPYTQLSSSSPLSNHHLEEGKMQPRQHHPHARRRWGEVGWRAFYSSIVVSLEAEGNPTY